MMVKLGGGGATKDGTRIDAYRVEGSRFDDEAGGQLGRPQLGRMQRSRFGVWLSVDYGLGSRNSHPPRTTKVRRYRGPGSLYLTVTPAACGSVRAELAVLLGSIETSKGKVIWWLTPIARSMGSCRSWRWCAFDALMGWKFHANGPPPPRRRGNSTNAFRDGPNSLTRVNPNRAR